MLKLTSAVTQFRVSNLDAAMGFYVKTLGFTEKFRFGDYAGVLRNNVQIHLLGPSVPNGRRIGEGALYIFCANVDGCYAEIVARGGNAAGEPKDQSYGLRDFLISDLDGNTLTFGERLKKAKEPKVRASAILTKVAVKAEALESAPQSDSPAVLAWQRYIAKVTGKDLS